MFNSKNKMSSPRLCEAELKRRGSGKFLYQTPAFAGVTIFVVFLFVTTNLFAAGAPVPVSQREKLKSLQTTIEKTQTEKKETEEKARKAEGELKETKSDLVKVGKSVQKSEKTLSSLEEQMAQLEEEKAALALKLHNNRRSIGNIAMGLERIRRVPPEALIVRPGAPFKTAQSVMLMEDIVPVLNRRAGGVKKDLDRLEEITVKLENQKLEAAELVASMSAEQAKLEDLAKKRHRLFVSTSKNVEEQEASLQRYAAQSQTLQELMTKIEEQGKTGTPAPSGAPRNFAKSKTILPQTGSMRLPVSGAILVNYNEPDNFGAPSKGLTIESRPDGLVVAPMGGVVRFAGPFKNYGNMLIVEHKKGFHSLIAGLEKIDTVVGQSVSAGEPLGFAHKKSAEGPPSVYYELRQNGEPVNPARTFTDLG